MIRFLGRTTVQGFLSNVVITHHSIIIYASQRQSEQYHDDPNLTDSLETTPKSYSKNEKLLLFRYQLQSFLFTVDVNVLDLFLIIKK